MISDPDMSTFHYVLFEVYHSSYHLAVLSRGLFSMDECDLNEVCTTLEKKLDKNLKT